jgi:hypothetical protein
MASRGMKEEDPSVRTPSLTQSLDRINEALGCDMPTPGTRIDLGFCLILGALRDLTPDAIRELIPMFHQQIEILAGEAAAVLTVIN